ncbi:sigma-54 dependent transcriptional regulator [candidate division KSB1 bacterium]|nr:sigma-54 dependent transcriptional regulator [candidate division KSB1 bacterium]
MAAKILVVDDEQKIRLILTQILQDEGFTIQSVGSGEAAVEIAPSFEPDLILMDQNMPGMNGIETMAKIKARFPEITVIILTAFGSIPLAVDAVKKGAYDYLAKPFDNDKLLIIIHRALEHRCLTAEVSNLKKQLQEKFSFTNIIGVSPKMQQVFEQINRVCATDATVLIQGESGTGKELIMKAIHYHSHRKDQPLVTVNCGAVPFNLLESEFFGHEKGAFTDAKERKIGKFEQAQDGTIFLDEIGELPLDAQVKLLRVLDERKLTRIGGNQIIPLNVRVIAATNKDLQEEINNGKFRLDLFYRLNIVTINVPPLRERKEDISLLVEHFIDKYNKRLAMNVTSVSQSAMSYLQDYPWPGNVRDLENAIQSAMILVQGNTIRVEDLPLRLRGYPEISDEIMTSEKGLEAQVLKLTQKIEKELIIKALEKCDQNRTNTAELLKISRKTLFNKMRQYGLE